MLSINFKGILLSIVILSLCGCGKGVSTTGENISDEDDKEKNQISNHDISEDTVTLNDYTVNAGEDQLVFGNTVVSLTGKTSLSEGETSSYEWLQLSGDIISLENPNSLTASFVALIAPTTQDYVFQLTVFDNSENKVTDTISVTVKVVDNIQPNADAGKDITVLGQERVTLSGSGTDQDDSIASYVWSQISGPSVFVERQSSSTLSFNAPLVIGSVLLGFELSVTDDKGGVTSDSINVTVTDKGSRQVVSATGMRAVGYPEDYVYYGVDKPAIGRNGHVAFFGVADTNIQATDNASNSLWGGMANNLKLIIKEGDAVEGLTANIQFESGNGSPPIVTKSGYIGFFSKLKGAINTNLNLAIMAQVENSITTVIRVGTSAPGLPSTSFISGLNSFLFTDSGMLIFGTVDFGNTSLWYWNFETIKLIATTDIANKYSVSQEFLSFNANCPYAGISSDKNLLFSFGGGGISNQGDIVFTAVFADSNCSAAISVLGWKDDSVYKIIDTSAVIDNLVDAKFSSMAMLDINDNGDILIGTLVSQPRNSAKDAVWYIPDGEAPRLVAMAGELVPNDYNRELAVLFSTSKFMLDNSGGVIGTAFSLAGLDGMQSILFGLPRVSQPYESLGNLGASQLDLVVNNLDVPFGYSSKSSIEIDAASMSINGVGNLVFGAEVYDAIADRSHYSVWRKKVSNEIKEIVKTGQVIRINGDEQVITQIFFQGGSTTRGSYAQYDDSDRLFISGKTNGTYQANILITPEN